MRYLEGLKTIPDDKPDNALYLGTALHTGLEIDVEEFIGVKSYKAKGKRITTFTVDKIHEMEPLRFPEETEPTEEETEEPVIEDPDNGKSDSDILDELTGQMKLF